MPKLSVIVPVYNIGNLITRCIESLINQSFTDMEIIIVNDGSTDDFAFYFAPYKNNKRIKYIDNKENHGLGFSRNIGMSYAQGEYISFVDSDDWIDLDMFSIMMEETQKSNSDIVICGVKNEHNNYNCSENRYAYSYLNRLSKKKALSLLTCCESNNYMISPVVWNKVYKRSIIKDNNIHFLENSYWEDDVFTYQVFNQANQISIVPNINYHYYQREKSITNDFSKKHIDDLITAFYYLYTYLSNNQSTPEKKQLFCSYFDRAISSLLQMLFKNEPSIVQQKQYIIYLYKQFSLYFSVEEAINYLDIERIKRLFR